MDFAQRPPYVRFETRAEEDRNATIAAGHYVGRNVDYALITPQGTKDVVEKIASEWLEQLMAKAAAGEYPADWARHFEATYAQWKETNTIPEHGAPIKGWQLLSPAQQQQILAANIRTVEDLAAANEVALMRIGMGGRDLKQKAQAWLEAAQDKGGLAAKNAALEAELASLRAEVAELQEYRRQDNDKRRKRAVNE